MKPVDQKDPSPNGDCLAACLASLLEIDIEEFPNFCGTTTKDWWAELQNWLAKRGLCMISIVLHKNTPWYSLPHYPWAILIGLSKAGISHAVVGQCREDQFVVLHDPHPNKTGIDRVDNVCLLVPLNPANYRPERKRILASGIVPMRRNINGT